MDFFFLPLCQNRLLLRDFELFFRGILFALYKRIFYKIDGIFVLKNLFPYIFQTRTLFMKILKYFEFRDIIIQFLLHFCDLLPQYFQLHFILLNIIHVFIPLKTNLFHFQIEFFQKCLMCENRLIIFSSVKVRIIF